MTQYKVAMYREWTERGHLIVEAESESEARELGREALSDDDDGIHWFSDNMEPGNQDVEATEVIDAF